VLIALPACMRADDDLPRYRKAAAILDPELMSEAPEPHQYNSSFKNPCWQAEDGRLRCLPVRWGVKGEAEVPECT
jgi:hypothetical protein